jgi:transcriptional regulator with XRE-family HTH domain
MTQVAQDGTPAPGGGEPHVGTRVREYRMMRRLTLRALGEAAGVSPSFLSQLENGRTDASVGSLRRISMALGVSVADLFETAPRGRHVVLRRENRPEVAVATGSKKFTITQPPLRHLEIYTCEFSPGGSTGDTQFTHGDAQEVMLVISGEVTLELGDKRYTLGTGDSIEYDTSTPHRTVNSVHGPAEVLWMISPPTPDEVPAEQS